MSSSNSAGVAADTLARNGACTEGADVHAFPQRVWQPVQTERSARRVCSLQTIAEQCKENASNTAPNTPRNPATTAPVPLKPCNSVNNQGTGTPFNKRPPSRMFDVFMPPSLLKGTPFAGCQLRLRIEARGIEWNQCRWTFASEIYHPLLHQGHALCACMHKHAYQRDRDDPAGAMMNILQKVVRQPGSYPYCSACKVNQAVLAESLVDPEFFARKARLRTPGARRLDDSDICHGRHETETALFKRMLQTGRHSDLRIIVMPGTENGKQVVFRCHRTILAAHSKAFATLFKTSADGGELRVENTNPQIFAIFLQFVYTGELPRKHCITPVEAIQLGSLAFTCNVSPLQKCCLVILRSSITVQNFATLLLANQKYREPVQTQLLLTFLGSNLSNILKMPGWSHLIQCMPGNVGGTLKMLGAAAAQRHARNKIKSTQSLSQHLKQLHHTHHRKIMKQKLAPRPCCSTLERRTLV